MVNKGNDFNDYCLFLSNNICYTRTSKVDDIVDIIRLKNIKKQYKNGTTALYDLNLNIEKGSFVFIIGGSGSGKSTLMKLLYREEKPTSGQIMVGGLNVAKLRNSKVYKLRRKLGIVFQDYRLLPKLTVYENVAFAMEVIGATKAETRVKVLKSLEIVGLKNKIHNYPSQLSGGEQQRVAIARALVNNPKMLLCDEPTGNLDPEMSLEVMRIIEKINKDWKTTVLVVTHDKEIVNKLQKQVITLKEGRLINNKVKGTYDDENA